MNGYIKWSDLALAVITLAVSVSSVYVILLVRNLNGSIKILRSILQENKDGIDKTIKDMPVITRNVSEITDTAKNELKAVESVLHSMGETAELTAATAETVKGDIIGRLKSILDIIDFIKRLIFKDKKADGLKPENLKKEDSV